MYQLICYLLKLLADCCLVNGNNSGLIIVYCRPQNLVTWVLQGLLIASFKYRSGRVVVAERFFRLVVADSANQSQYFDQITNISMIFIFTS